MGFKDIIDFNAENYCKGRNWWATDAFHFTDVTNVVKILDCGYLYSRMISQTNNLMQNDNASRQVIDMTALDVLRYVRFYFRPLTPTQYHNEGYKHPQLRYDQDVNANVSVPVFLIFDLQSLLQDGNTLFSEKSQAGYYTPDLLAGPDNFSKLNFSKIYENGPMENSEEDIKYRQAEILYPEKYPIKNSLKYVVCRNEVERRTLLKLLKDKSNKLYAQYKDKVRIFKKDIFENNGLFVNSITYYNGHLEITFNPNGARQKFCENQKLKYEINELQPVACKVNLKWFKANGELIYEIDDYGMLDYETIGSISCNLADFEEAKKLEVNLYLDNNLMCSFDFVLNDSEIF